MMGKTTKPAEAEKEKMSQEFKEALAKKEAEKAKKQQAAMVLQMKRRESAIKARRTAAAKAKEAKIADASERIAKCNEQIKEAEEALKSADTYSLLGNVLLGGFGLMLLITVILSFAGIGKKFIVILMLASFTVLAISVFFQLKPMAAEKKLRDSSNELKEVQRILSSLKNRR